jgi:hypothetical protein
MRAGGVQNRAGLRYIGALKVNSVNAKLIPYHSEVAGESILIEAGANYLRFFKNGAAVEVSAVDAWSNAVAYAIGDLVEDAGVNYYCKLAHTNQAPPNATYWHPLTGDIFEVPTPFSGSGLFHYHQSGRVITLTHQDDPPHELIYDSLTRWIIRPVETEPSIAAPENLGVTIGVAGSRSVGYLVTAAADETYEESEPSNQVVTAGAGEPTPDNPDVLTWDPVAGASEYYIYYDPNGNGTYGYIGTATGVEEFRNTGFIPDFNLTPPIARPALFGATGDYPATSATYQQRRFFANTENVPDGVWGSRTGFPSNFGIASPLQDDDAVTFRVAGNQHNPVRHLVGLKQLILLTDSAEWTIGQPKQPITPSNIPADTETYAGSSSVQPVIVGNAIIFAQARNQIIRDLQFDINVNGFAGRDLTVFSSHLFEGKQIRRITYAQSPDSIVWVVPNDGRLLGLTYLRELDEWGWHRHDTGASGLFEDVCVVPEAEEDAVYVIVRRTIDGGTVRYIERLERRVIDDFDADAFFVDSGLSYSGAPATTFAGLDHLEGETVSICADGADAGQAVVSGGEVTISAAASEVHVGLPITGQIETLDLDVGGVMVRDKQKLVKAATLLIERSAIGFGVGPSFSQLVPSRLHPWETASDENTLQVEVVIDARWDKPGRVCVEHTAPLPLTVLGVLPNLSIGG